MQALIAHYTFDEPTVTGVIDSAGGNSNSTAINNSTGGSAGQVGGAWSLAGDGGVVIDTTSTELTGLDHTTSGLTLAGWVNTTDGNDSTIFSISDNTVDSDEFAFRIGSNNLQFLNRNGSGIIDTGTIAINDGAWHHIALTVSTTGAYQMYVDGVADTGGSGTGVTSPSTIVANSVRFGSNLDSTGGGAAPQWFYTGLIDEFRIYDNVESASNIAALAAVPEPSSAALLGLGGLALILRRRK